MTRNLEAGRLYLIRYTYTQDDVSEECMFGCKADGMRAAAEKFWNQHPGKEFALISVNDGEIEGYWHRDSGKFFTIPQE